MRRFPHLALYALAALVIVPLGGSTAVVPPVSGDRGATPEFAGEWLLDGEHSTAIDPWRQLKVEIDVDGEDVVLKRMWRGSREGGAFVDSVRLVPGSTVESAPMAQWPDNRHLGAYIAGNRTKTVTSRWEDEGRTLVTESELTVSTQQGERPVRIYTEYRLSPEGDRLDVLELRSTRPRPVHYVFHRADAAS